MWDISWLPGEEVKTYVEHHMNRAGAKHPVFTNSALEALAACSKGYPRLLNKLAIQALLYGCLRKAEQIDADLIRIAAEETGM